MPKRRGIELRQAGVIVYRDARVRAKAWVMGELAVRATEIGDEALV
jgi:hypothetical protein